MYNDIFNLSWKEPEEHVAVILLIDCEISYRKKFKLLLLLQYWLPTVAYIHRKYTQDNIPE